MESVIKWQEGIPTEYGLYLVLRADWNGSGAVVEVNTWDLVSEMDWKECPVWYSKTKTKLKKKLITKDGWLYPFHDYRRIIAWCKIEDIKDFSNMCEKNYMKMPLEEVEKEIKNLKSSAIKFGTKVEKSVGVGRK